MGKPKDVVAAVRQEFITSLTAAAEAVDGTHAASAVPLERALDAIIDIGPYASEPYLRGSTMHVRIWRGDVAGCERTVAALTPAYRYGHRSHASAFDWDAVVATAMACRLSPAELRRTFLVTDLREGDWHLITFVPAPRLPLSARIQILRAGQRHVPVPLKHRLTPLPAETLHALVGESVETYPERTRTKDNVAAYATRQQAVTIPWDPRDLNAVRDAAHHLYGTEEALCDRGQPQDTAAAHRLSATAIALDIHHAYRREDHQARTTDAVILQRPRLTTSETEAFTARAHPDRQPPSQALPDLRHLHHLITAPGTRLTAEQRSAASTALAHLAQRLGLAPTPQRPTKAPEHPADMAVRDSENDATGPAGTQSSSEESDVTTPYDQELPAADRYHLVVHFRPAPDGPAVEGTWTNGATALRKFTEWIGSHGSEPGIQITLEAETDGVRTTVRQWPDEPPQR